MIKLTWIGMALLVLCMPVAAQPTFNLSPAAEATLRNELQSNNFAAVQKVVENNCSGLLADSRTKTATVSERARSARGALDCATRAAAVITALAASNDRAFQARELLKPLVEEYRVNQQRAQSEEDFLGLRWGVGLGYSFGRSNAIDDAEIVGGVVRVKSELKQQPRVLFEFHKFFWCNEGGTVGTRGCGPFIAAAATQDKVLSGVGMGFMYGMKTSATDVDGFSVGLGAILDAKVKDLADGFRPNQPPPAGETVVRYKEKARWSTLLFVTRTF